MAKHKVEAYVSKRAWEERKFALNMDSGAMSMGNWKATGEYRLCVGLVAQLEAQIHRFFTTSVFISCH